METDLSRMVSQLGSPKILVLGDLILDRYTWGDAERISPEAPVMVLRADQEEVRLGGAASVASLLRALEAKVSLAGVTGEDGAANTLRRLLQDESIDYHAILADAARPTTSKERLLGRTAHRSPQQILRVDREERRPLEPAIETKLTEAVLVQVDRHATVLISDYAKGTCTPALLARVIDHARTRNIPVLIDPARIADYARYRRATLITPNRVEAEMATGRKIRDPEEGLAAARQLSQQFEIPNVLVKLDRDGMVLMSADQPDGIYPTCPRAAHDVTGAGDMVLAMVGLCRASGLAWPEAVQLANVAAGIEVEKLGVAPVSRSEIHGAILRMNGSPVSKIVSLSELLERVAAHRRSGEQIVLTNGCFDLLHVGHVSYLQEASQAADVLIVAINSDEGVRRLKGPQRPVIRQADRARMLAALGCVDYVVVLDEDTPHELLRALRPEVLVKGGTYTCSEVVGHEVVRGYGGRVAVLNLFEGISTSKIIGEIVSRNS